MILHFDFSTGASGDKILGALLELCETRGCASFADVQRIAAALVPNVQVRREQVLRGGVRATHITVEEPAAPVRHWHEIRALIEGSGVLPQSACDLALSTFKAIAEAEAAVHGVAVEQVHFHEVGAADSIIDIVISSFLFDALSPEAVYASPLALGYGTFHCAHGELPVPAPATARLIEGLVVMAGHHKGELTTPTGAALARAFVTNFEPLPACQPLALGYGAGTRELPHGVNVVRALLGKAVTTTGGAPEGDFQVEGCVLLESNIDHLSPEALAFACEELLTAGALDVWQESITMKKGRLAVKLSALAYPPQAQRIAECIAELTGTLGVRSSYVERTVIPRTVIELETPYGVVPFKAAALASPSARTAWLRPEHDAVAALARSRGLNYNALYEELVACATEHAGERAD